jgi:hypothetical protein
MFRGNPKTWNYFFAFSLRTRIRRQVELPPPIITREKSGPGPALLVIILYGRGVFLLFDGLYFSDPSQMSSACEIGAEPDLDHFAKKNLAQKFAGDAKNIGVIMMTRNAGAKLIVTKSGADAFDFVGANAHSDTSSASQNGPVGLLLRDGLGGKIRRVRIVNRGTVNRPDVNALMAQLDYDGLYHLFGFVTAMIASNRYFHNIISSILFVIALSMRSAQLS